jgi:photosystem II stability/assembly factor-like uncharacterized protein
MKSIRLLLIAVSCMHLFSCHKVTKEEMVTTEDASGTYLFNTDTVISRYNYNDMFFFNENTGLAVGNEGKIIKTTDAGTTWVTIPSGTNQSIRSIEFVDENLGWAASTGCLLKTINGGNTWSVISTPAVIPATRTIYSVSFRNEWNGIAVCQGGGTTGSFVLVTNDGGTTWTGKTIPAVTGLAAVTDLRHVAWYTDDIAYAVGANGTVIKTIDKGVNWSRVTTTNLEACTIRFNNLSFINNIGYAAGQSGMLLKIEPLLTDKITLLPLYTVDDGQNDTWFTDQNNGYIAGQYGELFKTSDGGISWTSQNTSSAALTFRAVQAFPSGKVYVIGNGIFLKSN